MKRGLLIVVITFVVTLTIVFSIRASVDALAVILGVILGVAASVPTTVLATYILMRQQSQQNASHSGPRTAQPPVVVINAPDKPSVSSPPGASSFQSFPLQGRKWTVIGDEETDITP